MSYSSTSYLVMDRKIVSLLFKAMTGCG